ncbi:DNA translocase FtsK [uncultured Ruminococcus sp.]|uniref:FtsK/SpoIIIE family DNA translocase n=1 Tax=uncultured Ruminococcus sp. TaxID=165186 RepID=UPI00263602B6|nr:DNA translocase FtsK [uncultured Ruminococcus sp.]
MAEAKKKNPPRSTAGRAPAEKPKPPAQEPVKLKNEQNQFWSIILFAAGLLTALMVLITGSAGWHAIHKFLLGMFGVAAFFVPMILVYTAIQIGMERSQKCVAGRAVWGVALMFLTSAAIQIFFVGELPGSGFGGQLKELYSDGADLRGGGVASVIIAGLLIRAFGSVGAKIITVIMFFVFGMLLSGLGLIEFLRLLARPFDFLTKCAKGFHCMAVGGEFSDGFEEDDDLDDEKEKKSFDKDLEAIELVNSRNKQEEKPPVPVPAPVPVPEVPAPKKEKLPEQRVIPVSVPVVHNSQSGEDFLLDIPLPTDHLIPPAGEAQAKKPAAPKRKAAQGNDELESLIAREAGHKRSELDIPIDGVPAAEEAAPEQPKEEEKIYILPPLDLLAAPVIKSNSAEAAAEMREKAEVIVNTFKSFGVEVRIKDIFRGPSITRYEIQPGPGVKVSKIKGLEDDIALNLAAQGVRIEAPVPGKSVVGIEVPNENKDMVTLREILSAPEFRNSGSKLTFAVGKDIAGNVILGDITKMPHVIIAGTTGSGKSVCTRSIIMSILYNAKPEEVKLILIDPKMVEFKVFDGIPHLLIPIVIDAKKAAGALNWAVTEMMRRYTIFSELGANDLKSYNAMAANSPDLETMAQIVVFIDELADMMLVAGKEVEDSICRLAQMGRAAGMHLVVATQRPTTDVITGLIKANIPSRIALSVMSQVDSRTIIDTAGADKLLGNGDMLYMPIGMNKPLRVQGCFASNKDITATLDFIKPQVQVHYDETITEAVENYVPQGKGGDSDDIPDAAAGSDEDFVERAMEVAVNAGQLSTSMLQRKLKLGYARAARIMDELEERGVIGPSEGAKPRRVLMSKMQFDERKLRRMNDID